jgi:Spy/CpxP family protein refolding chaperone
MKRPWVVVAGISMLAGFCCSVAQAQRPGGGRGFGGFGGMMNSSSALMGIEEVRKELKLSDAVGDQIAAAVQATREEIMSGVNFQDMTDADREAMQKRSEEANKKFDEMLIKTLTPEQQSRFSELRLQREGSGAFAREDVAKKLNLTDDQKSSVKKILEAAVVPPINFFEASQDERESFMNKSREAREKATRDLAALLTPEQSATWKKMVGEKFEFPAGFGGGGGRRPGGGNRPGRPPTDN